MDYMRGEAAQRRYRRHRVRRPVGVYVVRPRRIRRTRTLAHSRRVKRRKTTSGATKIRRVGIHPRTGKVLFKGRSGGRFTLGGHSKKNYL